MNRRYKSICCVVYDYENDYDGISTKILKLSIHYISSPVTYICNRMLSSGTFLARLKFAEIKPIYKKGDKSNTSNYRPLSLLTLFSKIF